MAKRMLIMLLVVAAFIATIGFVWYRRDQTAMAQSGSYQPPPEAVTTVIAQKEEWQGALGAIGTVAAVNGVMVSADLPGVVPKIAFGSGDPGQAGQLLRQLDTRQRQAPLP